MGGIGIWTVISKHNYVSLMTTSTYPALAYALIVAGVLAVVGSWLGCGGVTSENRCVLLIVSNQRIFLFFRETLINALSTRSTSAALNQSLSLSAYIIWFNTL